MGVKAELQARVTPVLWRSPTPGSDLKLLGGPRKMLCMSSSSGSSQ